MFDVIAFDADDTLWHNENLYSLTQEQFRALLLPFAKAEVIDRALYDTEMRNLEHFGYGVKSFALSMIETAVELTEGRVSGEVIGQIIEYAKVMRAHPVELFEHTEALLDELGRTHRLMLITKGDLFEQESKVARSGVAERFEMVEIVSDKDAEIYSRLLARHGIAPQRFLMVGNSLRSDVLPVVEIGGTAVYIPYHITWEHEHVSDIPEEHNGYYELSSLADLPRFLARFR